MTVAALSPDRLARWLLVAVALDLVVARIVVRLAIFVPKGEPWATAASVLGGFGALVDTLVPLVGLVLLVALLLEAGERGDRAGGLVLAGIAAVAVAGMARIVFPVDTATTVAIELVVVALACTLAVTVAVGRRVGGSAGGAVAGESSAAGRPAAPSGSERLARLAVGALAGAVALGALARAMAALGGPIASDAASVATIAAVGSLGYVLGVGLLGGAGLVVVIGWPVGAAGSGTRLHRHAFRRLPPLVAGAAVTLLVVAAAARGPGGFDAIVIWSLGLTAAVPVGALAVVAGFAVAGLPQVLRVLPGVALGGAIVALAGYGLASSGLLLATLLGLVVARRAPA